MQSPPRTQFQLNQTAVELENKLRKALLDLGNFRRRVVTQSETCEECGTWFSSPPDNHDCICPDPGIAPKRSTSYQLYNIEESESLDCPGGIKKCHSLNDTSIKSEISNKSDISCEESRQDVQYWDYSASAEDSVSEEGCNFPKHAKRPENKWNRNQVFSVDCKYKECPYAPKRPEKYTRPCPVREKMKRPCPYYAEKEQCPKEKVCRRQPKNPAGYQQKRSHNPYQCASSNETLKKDDHCPASKPEKKGDACACSRKNSIPCQCHLYKTPRETLLKRIKAYKQRDQRRKDEIAHLHNVHKNLIEQLMRMKKFAQELASTTQENGELITNLNRLLEEKQATMRRQKQEILEKESQIVKLLRNEMNIKQKCNQICNIVAKQNECPGLKKECQQLLKSLHEEMDKVMRKDDIIQRQAREICMLQCALDKRSAELSGMHQELGSCKYNARPKKMVETSTQCGCDQTAIMNPLSEACDSYYEESIASSNSNSLILKMTIR